MLCIPLRNEGLFGLTESAAAAAAQDEREHEERKSHRKPETCS